MRVTRIEIFGFKSFVERFVLNFDRNFIGIVGPNGCGKSNVVDALRWVLGETHAKQLRGSSFDDLIFNGSESRRPLGMAEVSLTIRPNDGWVEALKEKEKEVVLADQRDQEQLRGDSEAQDDEVSEDEEQSKEGEQPSEAKPEEPVADVNQLVPTTLQEIPGLFNAAEIQLTRRLYRSGESEFFINRVPCRLRDLIDLYRLIGLGSRGLSIVQQGEIGEFIAKKPTERRELLEEAAGISGFRARMETAQRKLERTTENMGRLADIIIEVEKQTKVLKRQAQQARVRNELKEKLSDAELELYTLKAARILNRKKSIEVSNVELSDRLQKYQSELAVADSQQEELRAVVTDLDVELTQQRQQRDQVYQIINRERERAQAWKIELSRLEGKDRSLENERQRTEKRREQIKQEIEVHGQALLTKREAVTAAEEVKEQAEGALKAVQQEASAGFSPAVEFGQQPEEESALAREIKQLNAELEKLNDVQAAVKSLEGEISGLRGEHHRAKDQLADRRVALASAQSELRSLRAQLEALTEQAAKEAIKGENSLKNSIDKVLAATITVPEQAQRALAAILGDKANYLVSSDPSALARVYREAGQERDKKKGQSSRIGVISKEPGATQAADGLTDQERAIAPNAQPLLELLKIEDGYDKALRALLDGVILVDTLEQGLDLNQCRRQAGRAELMIVSLAGEVVTPWGWYTTEGKGLLFSFTRRIEELEAKATGVLAEISGSEGKVNELNEGLRQKQQQLSAKIGERDRLFGLQRKVAQLVRQEKEEENRRREAAIREERKRRELALARERQAQSDVRKAEGDVSRAKSAVEYEEKTIGSLEREAVQLEQLAAELVQEQGKLQAERTGLLQQLEDSAEESKAGLAQAEAQISELESTIKAIEAKRGNVMKQLAEVQQHHSEIRKKHSAASTEDNQAQLALEKCGLELGMITEEAQNRYGEEWHLPSEEKLTEVNQGDEQSAKRVQELFEEVGKLHKRLEREGEVDPESIPRYESERVRLEEMKSQYDDLQLATKTLEKTIRQLKEISRLRFLRTFADVRTKFSELVPRLFGGGAGKLELINPDDPLTSGVEITVRPPGKRVASMDLLSGGEKTLVATAVLIATFLHKPSPICVLDEVDAPLDDANLDRFIEIIREISSTTQFLIITHNKETMAAVERLIGITMQESGVSTALTVTFEQVEKDIERWAANA